MTSVYDWFSLPNQVAIRCPNCEREATFCFDSVVKISLKKDIHYFQESPHFRYEKRKDSIGCTYHAALFNTLNRNDLLQHIDLPDGYSTDMWLRHAHNTKKDKTGVSHCSHCMTQTGHELDWHNDAFFQITIKHHTLWAYNRANCHDLMSFLASHERKESNFPASNAFLRHIPTFFKDAKNREEAVKKLTKCLL